MVIVFKCSELQMDAKMPTGSEDIKTQKFWNKPWRIGLLIAVVLIVILLAVLLPVLLSAHQTHCHTSICMNEAARIKEQIDPELNPCDDFYQFACGNYLKTANGTGTAGLLDSHQAEEEIVQLYRDPVDKNDHYMVQLSKKLFRACMNTTEIERDSLRTIKEVLKIVGGGWPIIEGNTWNETNFDWLQATYKLRELGYPFSIFLDVKVSSDPRNNTGYILEVRIPFDLDEATDSIVRKKSTIKKVALAFGVDVNLESHEMRKLYELGEKISDQMLDHRGLPAYPVYTVEQLHKNLGFINWLEFINKIAGPAAQISMQDSVMLVEVNSLRQRFDLLSKTSKRTQANYMMWKVVQQMAPYLTAGLQKLLPEEMPKQTRLTFCLREIQERFPVSPIEVLYARKFLSKAKRKKVAELVTNMKQVFGKQLGTTKWISKEDKQNVEDKARELAVVIGEPGNYFEDAILDDLNVDMKATDKESFLNLLSQVNRNYLSLTYGMIKKSNSEIRLNKRDTLPLLQSVYYYPENNLLRVPTSQLQNQAFNEHRPNYVNYGILGKELGNELSGLLKLSASYFDKDGNRIVGWSQETSEGFGNITGCLIKNMDAFKKLTFDFMIVEMQANIIGAKIAYDSYVTWAAGKREEQKLAGMDYTPEQLFWISTVSCHPNNSHPLSFLPDTRDLPRNIVYATMRNNPQFSKDFNCPIGSPMNPTNKCEMI